MQHFRNHKRAGFTLLEVLIATSVIMVGIFGIASAIALCEQLFKTSFRADMAANCGRAALETMLTENFMKDNFTPSATFTTPVLKTCNWTIGSSSLNLTSSQSDAADFKCLDHLRQNNAGINLEESPPNYDLSLASDYAWVGTIHQISGEYCEVSAAVAFKPERNGTQCRGISVGATSISDNMGVVRVQINPAGVNSDDLERLVVGQYVFLWANNVGGHWYRIGSFYDNQMDLYGPQWTFNATSGNIYTPGGVVAAYTQIVPIQNR